MIISPHVDFTHSSPLDMLDQNIQTLFEEANHQADGVNNLQTLPIVDYGQAVITTPVGPFVNQTFTVTIGHGLGYIPIFLVFYREDLTGNYTNFPLVASDAWILPGSPAAQRTSHYAYTDAANLYINCRVMNNKAPTQAPMDLLYTYYIFSNPAVA